MVQWQCVLSCVGLHVFRVKPVNFFPFDQYLLLPSLPPPYPVVLTRLLDTRRHGRGYYYLLEGAVSDILDYSFSVPGAHRVAPGGAGVLTLRALVWLAQGLFVFHLLFVWITWLTHGVCVCHPICSIVYCYPAPLVTLLSHHGLLLLPSTPICSGSQIPSSPPNWGLPISPYVFVCFWNLINNFYLHKLL